MDYFYFIPVEEIERFILSNKNSDIFEILIRNENEDYLDLNKIIIFIFNMIFESEKLVNLIYPSNFFEFFMLKIHQKFIEINQSQINSNTKHIFEIKELIDNLLGVFSIVSKNKILIKFKITEKVLNLLCLLSNFPENKVKQDSIIIIKILTDSFINFKDDKCLMNSFASINTILKENDIFTNLIQFDFWNNISISLIIFKLINNLTYLFNDFIPLESTEEIMGIFEVILVESKTNKDDFIQEMIMILTNLADISDKYKQFILDSGFLKTFLTGKNKFFKIKTKNLFIRLISKLTQRIKFGNAQNLIKSNYFEFCKDIINDHSGYNQQYELILMLKSLTNIFDSCEFLKSFNSNNTNSFLKIFWEKGGKYILEKMQPFKS